jgi:hypothetical protein
MVDEEKCMFCEGGTDSVNLRKQDGTIEKYYKRQCIEEYKLFMKKLMDKPNVADALARRRVNFKPKGE